MQVPLKTWVLTATEVLGLNPYARWHFRDSLVVLCYHGVVSTPRTRTCDRELFKNTVSTAEFEAHLDYVGRHVTAVSLMTS